MFSVPVGMTVSVWALALAYEDWRARRLPNRWLLLGAAFGLLVYLAGGSLPLGAAMSDALLAAGAGLLFFLPIYALGWMGAGDVKFAAVLGWLSGSQLLFATVVLSSLLAGVCALLLMTSRYAFLLSAGRFSGTSLAQRIPYGSCLAAAWVALIWAGDDWLLPSIRWSAA